MKKGSFILRKRAVMLLLIGALSAPIQAGFPVIDASNIIQTTTSAVSQVTSVAKQVQQYATQLQQYKSQLQNLVNFDSFNWGDFSGFLSSLGEKADALSALKQQVGSIDQYVSQFHDIAYYKKSACFTSAGCSQTELNAMTENRQIASESQKKANDALFQGLEAQQKEIADKASQLKKLQADAKSADGALKAIQAGNELASQMNEELLLLANLLNAQQTVAMAQMQADADKKAQEEAAGSQLRMGTFTQSSETKW